MPPSSRQSALARWTSSRTAENRAMIEDLRTGHPRNPKVRIGDLLIPTDGSPGRGSRGVPREVRKIDSISDAPIGQERRSYDGMPCNRQTGPDR